MLRHLCLFSKAVKLNAMPCSFLPLIKPALIRPVESRGIHESGTMGEMVTYRYYVGRLNMFEDQYDLAEQNFDYALRHCHRSAVANKKKILNYLVPVKLLRGRLPTSKCEYMHIYIRNSTRNVPSLFQSPNDFFFLLQTRFSSASQVFISRICALIEWNENG